MKILIQNYTSDISTEAMYFDGCFKRTSVESSIWNDNVSAFDVMDATSPDVLICHFAKVTQDIIKYLSRNKKHELVLNVTGATAENLNMVEQVILGSKIKCPFVFSNIHEVIAQPKPESLKFVNILPGADLFLSKGDNDLTFSVEAGIISTSKPDLVNSLAVNYETYHRLQLAGREQNVAYDLPVTVMNLTNLYDRYEKVVIADDVELMFSQVAFDAMAKSNHAIFQTTDNQINKMQEILATLFYDDGKENVSESIKAQVKSKHTCFNRAARLARFLGLEDESIQLLKVIQ